MKKNILNELYDIDITYFGSKKNNEYTYLEEFLCLNSLNSEKITHNFYKVFKYIIKNENKIPNKYKMMAKDIEENLSCLCIDFGENKIIKNEKDLVIALLCFFTYKSITTQDPLKFKKKELDDENDTLEEGVKYMELLNTSDFIINTILDYIEKLTIWLSIKYEKIKKINSKTKENRLALAWFLLKVSEDPNSFLRNENYNYPNKGKIYHIEKEYDINFNLELSNVKYSYTEYDGLNLYSYSYHYSTINTILKNNPRSLKNIKKSNSLMIALGNIMNSYIFISNTRLDSIIEDTCEEYKIKKEDIVHTYKSLINEYKNNIKFKVSKETINKISKEISIHLQLINLINIRKSNNKKKIYLPPMFCFRGRTYFLSSYSITFQKELRYCSHWGVYKNKHLCYKHNLLERVEKIIESLHYKIEKITKFNFKNKENKVKNSIIWLIISISETEKNKKSHWKIDELVDEGVDIIENWTSIEKNTNLEKKIKIKYVLNILKEIEDDIYKKWLISKDATASVFQHTIKTIGAKNENSLKWCNFKSEDTWYDTYAYIINIWKEKYNLTSKNNENYFIRNTLKSSIMTHNYGAVKNRSFKKFIALLNKDFSDKLGTDQEEISKIFNHFYDYMTNESHILSKSSSYMIEKLLEIEKGIIKFNDDTEIPLNYFKIEKKQIELNINGVRITKQNKTLTKTLDKVKIRNSIRANYIQGLDASLVRWFYSMNYKGITIHDCFMVDYMSVSYLIAIINQGMRIQFHTLEKNINFDTSDIFSIFILF